MDVQHPPGMKQWGYKLDCAAEGCLEKLGFVHSDDGDVKMHNVLDFPLRPEPTINGHAAKLVSRVIPDWSVSVFPCAPEHVGPWKTRYRDEDELEPYSWCATCGAVVD